MEVKSIKSRRNFVTVNDICNQYKISKAEVYKFSKMETFKTAFFKVGNNIRIDPEEFYSINERIFN